MLRQVLQKIILVCENVLHVSLRTSLCKSYEGERMQEGYSLQGSLYKQVLEAGEIDQQLKSQKKSLQSITTLLLVSSCCTKFAAARCAESKAKSPLLKCISTMYP